MNRDHQIEVVCHRAANAHAPENTRAAAEFCLQWGVDYIEVDVRTSKDGVMYILHDPAVDRTTNGHGLLCELAADEIDALDAGSWYAPRFAGERLPRLEPYLRWIKGKAKVFFDVKAVEPRALVGLIHDLALVDECFLWSGDARLMKAFLACAPELALKVNVTTAAEVEQAKREFNARIVEFGLNDITDALLNTCRRLNVKSMVLEDRADPDVFRRIIAAGIDMVNVDHADLFIRVRNEMARQSSAEL